MPRPPPPLFMAFGYLFESLSWSLLRLHKSLLLRIRYMRYEVCELQVGRAAGGTGAGIGLSGLHYHLHHHSSSNASSDFSIFFLLHCFILSPFLPPFITHRFASSHYRNYHHLISSSLLLLHHQPHRWWATAVEAILMSLLA